MDMKDFDFAKVKLSTRINYHCTLCGDCCRHIENSVILESNDAFRLARFFRETGQPAQSVKEVIEAYTDPIPLSEETPYPLFPLKAVGPDQSCIFLKDNRCTVQAAKPKTCRLYPFSVEYDPDAGKFLYYICREKPHHFTGGVTQVNDWMHENFTKEDREYTKLDFEMSKQLGLLLRRIGHLDPKRVMTAVIYYKFFKLDPDAPFLPQYQQNNKRLLRALEEMVR